MIESKLNQTIEKEIENLNRSKNKQIILITAILLLILTGIYFLKPEITGFITLEKQFNYSDIINLDFEESSEYIWIPEHTGTIKALKLSGSYKTEGNVKVYLEDEGIKYLIFDSSKLAEEGIESITGLAVLDNNAINNQTIENNNTINNDSITNNNILNNNESVINENSIVNNETNNNLIINETLEINKTQIIDETIIENKTPIINETIEEIINKTINIDLEYKPDSVYDSNNDGIEDISGIIDLTVENTKFNWQVNEENLCTRWETYSVENKESTIVCYGSQKCCSFVELMPTRPQWNEPFYSAYGQYGATSNNIVSAQVLYVDYNLSAEEPFAEIYNSEWQELSTVFTEEFTSFENICIETCALNLNKTNYKLIIEIENSTLKLATINYIISEIKEENNAPILIKDIPNQTITKEGIEINLSEYFTDPDNDILTYNYYKPENINILIENNIATIIPYETFTGTAYLYFTANDSIETAVSNLFNINITKEKEKITKSEIVINKPVKWLKNVKLGKIESNVTVNITSFATNITVRKISEGVTEDIPEDKIKIKANGAVKELREYETEKENIITGAITSITGNAVLENALPKNTENYTELIIEDLVEEVEVEYYTPAPTSEEVEINDYRKQIIISSDIHYEDILAYTNLPIDANSEVIKLYWLINNSRLEVSIDKYDTNNNSLIDYIEWIVPSLSNQTYELIIEITKAEHLDENRNYVEDVYNLVKARDNNWTDLIPLSHYVRVAFKYPLNKDRDITIYARSNYTNVSINVFEYNKSDLIASFENIQEDKEYKIFLTGMPENHSQDVFDLLIIGTEGGIEFDYIVDPDTVNPIVNGSLNKSISSIYQYDVINATFNATDEVNLTNATIQINNTGIWRYFNFSLNGSANITLQFSQNFTITEPAGTVVNITGIARDNSSNEAQNSTVFTVAPLNCTTLDRVNTIYNLTQNVSSSGTCFNITASSVTLDCHGYEINYSQSSAGYGVSVDGPYTYATIKSCNIVQGSASTRSYGIVINDTALGDPTYGSVLNTTITTYGDSSSGIYSIIYENAWHNFNGINITTYGASADGIFFNYAHYTNLTNIRIETIGATSVGITTGKYKNYNNITITSTDYGIDLPQLSQFFNTIIKSGSNCVHAYGGDDINFTDSNFTCSSSDIFLENQGSKEWRFVNTSWLDESVGATVNLTRWWYLTVYVNDSNGNAISGATVKAWNNTYGDPVFTETTAANGYIARQTLLEYNQSGTEKYYWTNYTINATKAGYNVVSKQINLTSSNNTWITLTDTGGLEVNTSLNKSLTNILQGDVINISANITDNIGLSFCQFIHNMTGIVNITNVTLSGTSTQCSNATEINVAAGNVINFTIRANDTSNNWRTNDTIITVIETILPVVNTTFNMTQIVINDVINFSGNITDETGLLWANITYNMSETTNGPGVLTKINFSLSGTKASIHNVTNITCGAGCVINFTMYATDTSNNVRQNSTLINVIALRCGNLDTPNYIYNLSSNVSSSGTCFNITASSVTLDCKGYTINYSQSQTGYGVAAGPYNNVNVKNCIIVQGDRTQTSSYGIYYEDTFKSHIANNTITTSGGSSYGIFMTYWTKSFNTISNSTITTSGDTAYGINTPSDEAGFANVTNTIITTNGTGSRGISASDDWIISNVNITTTGPNGIGIEFNGNNIKIFNVTIKTNASTAYGLYTSGGINNNITSSSINASNANDIYLQVDGYNWIFLDTNYTDESVSADSSLERRWYLNVYVNDSQGNAVSGATVTGWNKTFNQIFSESTASNGYITKQILTEYTQVGSTKTHWTNYTINATKAGYNTATISINLTSSNDTWITLTDTGGLEVNTSLNKSLTNILQGDVINISANITDNIGLSFCQFIHNQTGIVNYTNVTLSGTSAQCSNATEINVAAGNVINFTIRVNDTSNNFRTNDTIITVIETILPVVNITLNKSFTNIKYGDMINLSANATDNFLLSYGQIIVNDTGAFRYFNFSLSGTAAEFSQNITVSCTRGCAINFTARVNDSFNNFKTNDTIITLINTPPDTPTIIFPTSNLYTNLQPLDLNVTAADGDNDVLNISYYINGIFNHSSLSVNSTFNASNGYYTLNVSVFDGTDYSANVTVNFTIDTAPPNVTFKAPTPNNNTAGSENVVFNWTATDTFGPNITCYPTIDNVLNATLLTPNGSHSNTTVALTGGNHTIKVTCFDTANNSNTTEERKYTVGIINITTPGYDDVIRPSENIPFNVNVIAGASWVNNITLIIFNETFYMSNATNPVYTYTYPAINVTPRYVNATAYAFNNVTGASVNVTSQIQLRIGKLGTTQAPTITTACSNESYTMNATNVTIETISDLDTLLEIINVTIIMPDGQTEQPMQLLNATDSNFITKFNYSNFTSVKGTYTITTKVKDIENQTVTVNNTMTVSNFSRNVNITKISISTLTFNDVCSGKPIISGTSATIPNVSYYDANPTITTAISMSFKNMSLHSNLTNANNTFNYTARTNETAAPSGQRRVDLWDLTTNIAYKNATLFYNYSSIAHTLTSESSLKLYRCPDINNCVLTEQSATLNTTSNMLELITNLSRFMLTEPTVTEIVTTTTTVTTSSGGGGGGGGGSIITRTASLDMVIPSPISMRTKDTLTVPIILKNTGEVNLNEINLSSSVKAEGITVEIEDIYFESLDKNESVSTNVIITTALDENATENEITITANVKSPELTESVSIIIDTVDIYKGNKTIVEEKIKFTLDLFDQNPECLELKELLKQAEIALENKEFKKAQALTESAIEACRQLVGNKGLRPVPTKPKLVGFKITLPLMLLALIIILALIIYGARKIKWKRPKFGLKLRFPKRKHEHRKMGPTKEEIGAFESEEKEIGKMLRGRV